MFLWYLKLKNNVSPNVKQTNETMKEHLISMSNKLGRSIIEKEQNQNFKKRLLTL